MTDYKATFEQWNDVEQWANSGSHASTDHCILELLSRVERLEEEIHQENICNNKCIQIIAERFDRLERTIDDNCKQTSNLKQIRLSLVKRAVGPTDKELCETYRTAYYAEENRQGPHCMAAGLRAVLARWGQS